MPKSASDIARKFEKKNRKVKASKNAEKHALSKNKSKKKKKKKTGVSAGTGYSEYSYMAGRRKPDAEDAVPDYVKYNPTRVYADAAQGNLESAYMGQKRKKKKAPRAHTGASMPALGRPKPHAPRSERDRPHAPSRGRAAAAAPRPPARSDRRRVSAAGEALFSKALFANTDDLAEGELRFTKNSKIKVLRKSTSGWWDGEDVASGRRGRFPANYVSEPQAVRVKTVTAVALFACKAERSGEISFKEGDTITILAKEAPGHGEGWWVGRNEKGKKGAFPSNYVKVNGDCCVM